MQPALLADLDQDLLAHNGVNKQAELRDFLAAIQANIGTPDSDEARRQLRAICRLARVSTVPLVTVPAAPIGSDFAAEIVRSDGVGEERARVVRTVQAAMRSLEAT